MTTDELIIDTLDFIESNLKEELSAEFLSARVGYSKVHFSRLFIFVVGATIHDYIVTRRLIHVAFEMKTKQINECLYEYGFDTQTGFIKAFKKKFGITPMEFKKNNSISIPSLAIKEMILNKIKGEGLMEPKIIKKNAVKIVGYEIETSSNDGRNFKEISLFWNSYFTDGRMEKLHSQDFVKKHTEYGVCYGFKGDGSFKYMIGVEVENFDNISAEFAKHEIPEAEFAVFTTPKANNDNFTQKIQETTKFIYNEWIPNSPYKFDMSSNDYELYDERSECGENRVMDICIPIIKK